MNLIDLLYKEMQLKKWLHFLVISKYFYIFAKMVMYHG